MHFKFKHLNKIIGAFFILTCILILGLLTIVARGQRWFQDYTSYHCYLSDGGGLSVGSPVMIKRLEAGKIAKLSLAKDNKVRIDLNLFSQYQDKIRQGAVIKLVEPLIGSSRLEVVPGPENGALIAAKGQIAAEEAAEGSLNVLIEEATKLIKELENPEGDMMLALDNINRATKNLADAMEKKQGTFQMLLENKELYENLNSSIAHLDSLLSDLDQTAPDLADAIVEARRGLEETNKVLRALQKSIFLRGNIEKELEIDSTLQMDGRAR
ncbi:MAG: MlaD family protein [Pseudomonadota bacterium]